MVKSYRVNIGSLIFESITYGIGDRLETESIAQADELVKSGQLSPWGETPGTLLESLSNPQPGSRVTTHNAASHTLLSGSDVMILSRLADDPPDVPKLREILQSAKALRRSLELQQALRAMIAMGTREPIREPKSRRHAKVTV